MASEWQKQPFFRELLDALRYGDEDADRNGTYAAGGNIVLTPQQGSLLESIHVEGVGTIQLPLTAEDVPKLVTVCEQAPYGHGLVVDTNVRRAWQLDASKVTFPFVPQFATETIQLLANKAVRALGLCGEALQVEAHFYKLLLYESSGHFSGHIGTEMEPGMSATLMLQLPTQKGFEGGSLVVHHSGQTKTYDFSNHSSTGFFYSIFFADCEHELLEITSGTRLCLVFNLVRANNSLDMQLGQFKGYSSRIAKIEATLLPWLEAVKAAELQGQLDHKLPPKLAIPLQHKYTRENLSFARLKGQDRLLAQVLKSCRDGSENKLLEIHLCILTKHQTGGYRYGRPYHTDDGDEDADHSHSMGEVSDESFESANWAGTSNKVYSFTLALDQDKEVVVHEDEEGAFDDGAEPDEVEYEGNAGFAGPTLDYWYHKAMIVIWPKWKTFSIACELGFSAVLEILKVKLAEEDSDFITLLRDTLAYCKRNSGHLLSQYHDRLLEFCVMKGALRDVLYILRLLSEPLQYAAEHASVPAVPTSVGINNPDTVVTIAKAVQKHGWEECGTDVMELLKQPHVALQGIFFGQLALELENLGLSEAALTVARRTLDLAFSASSSLGQLEAELVYEMAKLIFSFKEFWEEWGLLFVNRLFDVDTPALCSLVTQVYTFLSDKCFFVRQEFSRGDGVNGASLFISLCQMLTSRDFHRPKGSGCYIVDLVQIFQFLGINQLFDELIQALVDQSRRYGQDHLLEKILNADIIWKKLSGSAMGKRGLESLAEALMQQRMAKEKPVFDWCMPSAKLPNHPAVQEFLRGPLSSLVYTGVRNQNHARNFARKYFGASLQDGYSATAEEGGRGAGAYCTIRKTRHAFQQLVDLWEIERWEIRRLKIRIGNLHYTAQVTNVNQKAVGVLSPDSRPRLDKKQKIDRTEYIDLRLDD